MAPRWPEEVDVFSVPHSRMKKLVNKYSNMITTTDFRDELHLTSLLKNLMNVFTEFKAHEQIENILIMKELKNKLRAASVTNAAVCNCHSDNRLTDMLDLVEDGYRWTQKTEQERQMYGKKLRSALDIFTQNFIPHMEEEEEVFQPMLMQYFSYEELKELKAKVIYQHDISKQSEQEEYHHEKFVEDLCLSDDAVEELADTGCHFSELPLELCLQIFSYLGPRDLASVGQISQKFLHLSREPSLWSRLYPVHWAQDNWSFSPGIMSRIDGFGLPTRCGADEDDESERYLCVDEDADIDESGDSDETDSLEAENQKQILKEAKMLTAIVKHLLPKVGSGVKVCDLAFSRGLSSSLVHKILKLCPNMEVLDLTHTNVGDAAFKEFGVSGRQCKLRHLDLTGCVNITDKTLISLAYAGGKSVGQTSHLGYASDKVGGAMEIENMPWPCTQKLPYVCCGKRTACGAYPATGGDTRRLSVNEDCTQNGMEICSVNSIATNVHQQPKDSVVMVESVSCDSRQQSIIVDKCDPQTYDLDFVFMNLLFTSEETVSSSNMRSFTNAFSMIPLTAQLRCDKEVLVVDSSSQGSCPSLTKRTCYGTAEDVYSCNEKQCCKFQRASAVKNPATQMPCSGDKMHTSSPTHLNADHKSLYNSTTATYDTNMCNLEFLSLNGCYRISDEGLSALADGEGTPKLHHLDLSGCVAVTAQGLSKLVASSHQLDHANLYYCDNMSDDPYFTTASGCRNLQCDSRFCCSAGE